MVELSGFEYKCSAGETFDSIALTMYGHEKYAADLMNANPQYVSMTAFTGAEILALPVVEKMESDDDISYIPGTAPWRE